MRKHLGIAFAMAWGLVVLPLLIGASTIAFRYGNDPALGEPLFSIVYDPRLLWDWVTSWALLPEYRVKTLQGVGLAFVPSLLGVVSLGLRFMQGPLRPRTQDAEQSLGKPRDLRERGDVHSAGNGVVLGRDGKDVLRVAGDQHVLVLGPSGSGKGVGSVIPTLLEHRGSMLVNDPKAELATITGRHRASLGAAWIFNPTDAYAHCFNPLLELRGGSHLHGDCMMAADLIAKSGLSKDPVWEDAAAELLTALLLVVFEQGSPTLAGLHDLVLEVSAGTFPRSRIDFVRQVLTAHQKLEERVRSSVNFQTRTCMAFMSDPVVRQLTSRSEFRAGDLWCGSTPTTVYLSIPPAQHERLRPLTRLVVQVVTNAAMHSIGTTSDGRQKTRRALFLLDEFASLKRMESLELGIAVARGHGVRYCLIAQDIDQIRKAYTDKQSITANMGTIALMPGFSQSALETVSGWGGWSLQTSHSRGREMMKPFSVRTSESQDRRPVLNPADMLTNTRQVLVFHLGAKPTWLDRVRFFAERRYHGLTDQI